MALAAQTLTELRKKIRDTGLRATPQRIHILRLLGLQKHPCSVEHLVAAGRGLFDATTAYRTLEVLQENGLVRKLEIGQDRSLFELANDHHHHAVCVSCGRISDISMCVSPALDEKVRRASGFKKISSHSLEFFGLCATCA